MRYFVYVDDIREDDKFYLNYRAYTGEYWQPVIIRSYNEMIEFLNHTFAHDEFFLDLDHDLGFNDDEDNERNGYDICKYVITNNINVTGFHIHSMNPVGARNMRQLLTKFGIQEINI